MNMLCYVAQGPWWIVIKVTNQLTLRRLGKSNLITKIWESKDLSLISEGKVRDLRCCWLEDEGVMYQGNEALSPTPMGAELYLKVESSLELPDKVPAWLAPLFLSCDS